MHACAGKNRSSNVKANYSPMEWSDTVPAVRAFQWQTDLRISLGRPVKLGKHLNFPPPALQTSILTVGSNPPLSVKGCGADAAVPRNVGSHPPMRRLMNRKNPPWGTCNREYMGMFFERRPCSVDRVNGPLA